MQGFCSRMFFKIFILFFVLVYTDAFADPAPVMSVPQSSVSSECMDMATLKPKPCSDSQLFFSQGQGVVQSAYNAGDFNRLNKTYEDWCTGKERFPDGRWKLSQYGMGLRTSFNAWNLWEKDLSTIKKWQTSSFQSEAAYFVEANYWYIYAWKARGSGYANTVPQEGWKIFNERMANAKKILNGILNSNTNCPAPYVLMLDVLSEQSASEEELRAVYAEGIKRFPQYQNLYFAMAHHYEPKWGGSILAYEAFANEVVKATKNFEGMGMYARLYWLVDTNNGIPFNINADRPPYWNKLKAGYEDLMKRYPSSLHNLGKYAGVACRSNESGLYRMLRTKLDGYQNGADFYDSVDVCDLRHHWPELKDDTSDNNTQKKTI